MDTSEKIQQLRAVINKELKPLIDGDYVYLDLPYHNNIGDTLIWQGTLSFLKSIPYKCLYSTSYDNYNDSKVDNSSIILFQGGGNFGDLYMVLNDFRKNVIRQHPHQTVIILPQTVTYQNKDNLLKDAEFYANYPNVTICARDKVSYNILKEHFTNNKILLLPDMAFFIDVDKRLYKKFIPGKTLYLKRTDKEMEDVYGDVVPFNAEVHDWPTYEKIHKVQLYIYRLINIFKRVDNLIHTSFASNVNDFMWKNILRTYNVQLGCNFLAPYEFIYTTRLHVMILSILLHKHHISILDNKYGKLSSFYESWLSDLSTVKYIKK